MIKQGYEWYGSDMNKKVPMADKEFQIRKAEDETVIQALYPHCLLFI